jgi:hypothetical protein
LINIPWPGEGVGEIVSVLMEFVDQSIPLSSAKIRDMLRLSERKTPSENGLIREVLLRGPQGITRTK